MNMPAIPPPANVPKSDPPQVKISHGHNALAQNIALGVLLTFAFCTRNDFLVEWYVGAMLGGFGVVNLPVLFGRKAGSIGGITLLASMPKLVGGAMSWLARGHGGPFVAAALALMGCAGTVPPIQDARIAANKMGEALNRMRPALQAVCIEPPSAPRECAEAVEAYNDVQSAYELAQGVIDTAAAVAP